MLRGIEADAFVETLLNTLEGERHVRRALLEELVEVLAGRPGADEGRELLSLTQDDAAFARGLERLRARLARAFGSAV